MVDLSSLKAEDLQGLSRGAVAELATRMLAEIKQLGEQAERDARTIRFKDAKLEKITFELARLKAWKFGAHTERLNAEQRQMFETTAAEDEADLAAQLAALQGDDKQTAEASSAKSKTQPRRKPLPDHLRRVDHRHEPADTTCDCGQAMSRVGEDVSERLDVIPAEFFVHRHIRGKWACRCCQTLVQEPVDPQIIDKGIATAGLVAHTLVGRFIDHLPYYRLEQINARSGVVTLRSTLASWSGQAGAALMPLFDAHRAFILGARVLHADETPVNLLDPGAGKTRKAYVWAYARGPFDPVPGVVYDFCISRAARHAVAFLDGWNGTLTCDDYGGYDVVFKLGKRVEAGCLAHARRKFDELLKSTASMIAAPALQRIAEIYRIERELAELSPEERLAARRERSLPLWNALHAWVVVERRKVPDGGGAAGALDYSLKRWDALGRFLEDGEVSIDNNHCENLIRPWAMGRKAWLFAGSELAGQRAAVVMSFVHSAKLHGHDPWVYLKDVLERLPLHPNHRIDELLPHRWQAAHAVARLRVSGATLIGAHLVSDKRFAGDMVALAVDLSDLMPGATATISVDNPLVTTQVQVRGQAPLRAGAAYQALPFAAYRPAQFAPASKALYFSAPGTAFRWAFDGSNWSLAQSAVPGLIDLAAAPDEATVYASDPTHVTALDPVTLAPRSVGDLQGPPRSTTVFDTNAAPGARALAFSADGRAIGSLSDANFATSHGAGWICNGLDYSDRIETAPAPCDPDVRQSPALETPTGFGLLRSANGNFIVGVGSRGERTIYQPETRAWVNAPSLTSNLSLVAANDAGTRLVRSDGMLLGLNDVQLGNLGSVVPFTHVAGGYGISSGGRFGFVYGYRLPGSGSTQTASDATLWVLDMKLADSAGLGAAAVIGTIPLPQAVGCTGTLASGETCQHTASLSIAPGDGTAFILGPRGVVAVPLPTTVTSVAVTNAGVPRVRATSSRLTQWTPERLRPFSVDRPPFSMSSVTVLR